ncbi:hypothetical protein H0H92_011227 [Tricholoma furcatifolium]|nr:hypothetical protein H0H92_011227 [Tricholoma furcatifolium]
MIWAAFKFSHRPPSSPYRTVLYFNMSSFNKAKNVEVNDSTISTVSGNQNIALAENMSIYQNKCCDEVKLILFLAQIRESENGCLPPENPDVGTRDTTARPDIIRPHLKKSKKGDSTVFSSSASNERRYNAGRDAYIARSKFFRDSDASFLSKLHVAKNAGTLGSKVCLEGTRVSLLHRIHEWALNPSGERTLFLTGAAGMGKSAVAHTIARHLESAGDAIVPFFAFNRSVRERSSSQLIPTWMKHVAEHDSKYLSYLRSLKDDQICSADIVDQYEVLLVDGLSSTGNNKPLIFIIDALDECNKAEAEKLLTLLQNLLTLHGLPSYVQFFFTYRLDPYTVRALSDVSAMNISIDEEKDTQSDVHMFL